MQKSEFRFCKDIGMWASDRSREKSCLWKTEACKKCYNVKLEHLYPKMLTKDIRNDAYWLALTGDVFADWASHRRTPIKRFRFQTRGETFASLADVFKVRDILLKNSSIEFWIPTRAWRSELRGLIESLVMPLKNCFLQASTEPSTTAKEWESLKNDGWSTMFFGDDSMRKTPTGQKVFECPKTHKKLKSHCVICKAGCFRSGKQVAIHLMSH
jgi:hypothetical protein